MKNLWVSEASAGDSSVRFAIARPFGRGEVQLAYQTPYCCMKQWTIKLHAFIGNLKINPYSMCNPNLLIVLILLEWVVVHFFSLMKRNEPKKIKAAQKLLKMGRNAKRIETRPPALAHPMLRQSILS